MSSVAKSQPSIDKEQEAYEAGRDLYYLVRLNRASKTVKDMFLSVPNIMAHYDKQEGFEGEEDSKAFFRFIEAFYQQKPSTFRSRAKKLGLPHIDVFADTLKQPLAK